MYRTAAPPATETDKLEQEHESLSSLDLQGLLPHDAI